MYLFEDWTEDQLSRILALVDTMPMPEVEGFLKCVANKDSYPNARSLDYKLNYLEQL